MFHYVYLLARKEYLADGLNFYIGARSSKTSPDQDDYMGSGTLLPKSKVEKNQIFNKYILAETNTRQEALNIERDLCNNEWVSNPSTFNIMLGGNNVDDLGLIQISETVKKLWKLTSYRDKHNNFDYLHCKMSY